MRSLILLPSADITTGRVEYWEEWGNEKRVRDTEEPNTEVECVLYASAKNDTPVMSVPVLSHTDSCTTCKVLCAKSAGEDIIAKRDNVVCGEFQLSEMDKKPAALNILVPDTTYENNAESTLAHYDANISMDLEPDSTSVGTDIQDEI